MTRKEKISNCFIIPVSDRYLIYAPLTGVSALVNKSMARQFAAALQISEEKLTALPVDLQKLIFSVLHEEIKQPDIRKGALYPELLGIIPTRSCNGACQYCDFGAVNASAATMPWEIAAAAADWYAGIIKKSGREKMEIHFFGGEPALCTDIIEVVIHRSKLKAAELNIMPWFEITTNGQYDATVASFLGRHFNRVVLSLDGFEKSHNTHRPVKSGKNSYENALKTAGIISDSQAQLCIRCCVASDNVDQMEEFTEWACRNLRIESLDFEIVSGDSLSELRTITPPDPLEFALHFHRSAETGKRFGTGVVNSCNIKDYPVATACTVGRDAAIVSPDGSISSCYLLSESWAKSGIELNFGSVYHNRGVILKKQNIAAIRKIAYDKSHCESCFCKFSCAGGCHVARLRPGNEKEFRNFCEGTRMISVLSLLSDLDQEDMTVRLTDNRESLLKTAKNCSFNISDFDE